MTVLRRAHIEVMPDTDGFDGELKTQLAKADPGGKAGKQVGGQLNRALKRLHLDPIDIKANPREAFAAIAATEAKLKALARDSATVEVKIQTERSLAQLQRFKRQLGDTGDEAGKEFTSKFERDIGQLGIVLDRLHLPSIDITADPDKALKSIAVTEAALKELSGKAATVEIRVDAEKARGELARLKKQLGSEGGEEGGLLSGILTPLKSPAVLGTIAAAVAPVIGAAVSAGVIGGAGIGGVIGGVLLVKDDPRVAAAGKDLGAKLLGDLKADAGPFVEPVLAAAAKIEGRFDQMDGRIKAIFSGSSSFLDPLVSGALDGVDAILTGVESLITKGKPVIDAFGNSFSILGESIGKSLSVIAGGGPEAASALINIAKATGTLIEAVAYVVRGLTELYGVISYIPGKVKEAELSLAGWVGVNKDAGKSTAEATASVIGQVEALARNAAASNAAAVASTSFVATQDDVKAAQDTAKLAQDAYNQSLAALAPAGGRATMVADGLRRAIEALHGAQASATDANEAYEASWDSLSESIKANGRSLNIHTAAGRANRDALEAVAKATQDGYIADINAGVGIDQATKKHDQRIAALKEEAHRSHLNKDETNKLISTYGAIPTAKTTDLVLDGVREVVHALQSLYLYQRSLATGESIAAIEQKLRTGSDSGPAKRYGGYARGGFFDGLLPGPPSSVDNLRGFGPGGDGFGLAGGEFIVNAKQTAKYRGELEDLNAGRNGFAKGGYYPVDTSRVWPFHTDAGVTRIPSRAEVASKVVLAAPSGGRTSDWIVQAARQIVPGIQVLSKDRPGARTLTGNVSYHALGRAVDFHWNRKLAEVWNQRYMARTKELITPWQELNIENGRRHAYSPLVYNQHNFAGGNPHDHIAMAMGGLIQEPVLGVGLRSGNSYSFGERGPETVTPGVGGETHFHVHLHNAVITSKRQAVDLVTEAYNTAVAERRIKVAKS